jgi:hypothetical protein
MSTFYYVRVQSLRVALVLCWRHLCCALYAVCRTLYAVMRCVSGNVECGYSAR